MDKAMIDFTNMARAIRVWEQQYYNPLLAQPSASAQPSTPPPARTDPFSTAASKVIDKVLLSATPEEPQASAENPDFDINQYIEAMRGQLHKYDYTNAEAAPVNSYDKYDSNLVEQVMMTRWATALSGNAETTGHGWELTRGNFMQPQKLVSEIESLKGQLSQQLEALGVDRNQTFTLSQNQYGDLLVESDDDANGQQISDALNASEPFKQVFNLLKTAENVLNLTGTGDYLAERAFTLNVSAESLQSNVTIVQKGAIGTDFRTAPMVLDDELYLLARTGFSAQPTEYFLDAWA